METRLLTLPGSLPPPSSVFFHSHFCSFPPRTPAPKAQDLGISRRHEGPPLCSRVADMITSRLTSSLCVFASSCLAGTGQPALPGTACYWAANLGSNPCELVTDSSGSLWAPWFFWSFAFSVISAFAILEKRKRSLLMSHYCGSSSKMR